VIAAVAIVGGFVSLVWQFGLAGAGAGAVLAFILVAALRPK